jgi:NAD+ synthase (glutamine-hydrolysing)
MNYGFVKVASAIPSTRVADCQFNSENIEKLINEAAKKGAGIVVFPELSITGYSCGDLFAQSMLIKESLNSLERLMSSTSNLDIISIVGFPLEHNNTLLNCAAVLHKGNIIGIVPKTYIPNYKEFYEQRWFASSLVHADTTIELFGQRVPLGRNIIFHTPAMNFGIEICEDVWATIPPSSTLTLAGADVIFNLSASNDVIGKHKYLCSILEQQSARCSSGYVYSSCGFGESTTDIVFGGNAIIYENGTLIAKSERFSLDEQLVIGDIDIERLRNERKVNTSFAISVSNIKDQSFTTVNIDQATDETSEIKLTRFIEKHPFVPKGKELDLRCEEIFEIQTAGLAKRLVHTNAKSVVVGISGGLDSTLALLVCVRTFDKLGLPRKGITGITMPGFGTTDRTYNNSISIMESLGVSIKEISIKDACIQHFNDIEHDINQHDVTYENSQARERTQILMDYANKIGGLVIGTGDLSELALGWATYNGDHMSMYGVNASIPKTLVKYLVNWVAVNIVDEKSKTTLLDIVDTPISPELIPADENGNIKQKTEDLVGPYELHDFFLYNIIRFGFTPAKVFFLANIAFEGEYDRETIKKWLTTFYRRFFQQQFKRSCLPDGPKVGSVSLSPRGDWRMPSDASATLWLNECSKL